MLPFGVTIPATVPQGSEIPEGLMNNPVYISLVFIPISVFGTSNSNSISISITSMQPICVVWAGTA